MMVQRRNKTSIPEFRSYEEEATFWDTHSPLDFPDDFNEVVTDVLIVPSLSDIPPGSPARKRFIQRMQLLEPAQQLRVALYLLGFSERESERMAKRKAQTPGSRTKSSSRPRSRTTKVKSKA
jgi:hypothetical protein